MTTGLDRGQPNICLGFGISCCWGGGMVGSRLRGPFSLWISGIQHPRDGGDRDGCRQDGGLAAEQQIQVPSMPGSASSFISQGKGSKSSGRFPQGWKLQSWASLAGRLRSKFPSRKEGERLVWGRGPGHLPAGREAAVSSGFPIFLQSTPPPPNFSCPK